MDKKIWLFIFLGILLVNPLRTQAFSPTISNPLIPYEVLTMDSNIETEKIYLGELKGDPHMYEFTLGKETDLVVTLVQKQKDNLPLSLIVVRSNNNNRGVSEIGRLTAKENTWQAYRDNALGLSLSRSQTFNKKLGSGVYRLEVSTAENEGQYMLVVGTEPEDLGYFKTLSNIRLTQEFFGRSIFSMLSSSYVYYPIGIFILLYLIFLTWRKKEYLQQKFARVSKT
jgi:hypothetical protein